DVGPGGRRRRRPLGRPGPKKGRPGSCFSGVGSRPGLVCRVHTPTDVSTQALAIHPSAAPSGTDTGRSAPSQTAFWFAALIVVFNLLDAMLTLAVVHAVVATEANPLMAASLSLGDIPFLASKL